VAVGLHCFAQMTPGETLLANRHRTVTATGATVLTLALVARAISRRRHPFSFRDRSVIITGGARGFGFALAQELAREGAHLMLLARTGADLERALFRLQSQGAVVSVFECDVRDDAAVRAAVDRTLALRGRIDVLINNAGVIQMTPFEHATPEDFDESLKTHFWGPLHFIRACLPHLRATKGRIVNVASIGGRVAVPQLLPYCVGKAAAVALSEGLNAELERHGITVTTATPGLMRTGSHRNVVVRGRHRSEAMLFGAMSATPLTSMRADRAARIVLDAVRHGRAHVTPGWQARLLETLHAVTPELVASLMAAAVAYVLPRATADATGDEPQMSRDLDLGIAAAAFPSGAAAAFNQPVARGEGRP
jgi:NAD(P)-dependent dehydrogenase (short-subunit alcohol dehydrogenase family)